MECLPFVKRITALRLCSAPESPGDFSRKVFFSTQDKRGSLDSTSDSSIDIEPALEKLSPLRDISSSPSSSPSSASTNSDRYSSPFQEPVRNMSSVQSQEHAEDFDQLTWSCDNSTTFSLTNQQDIEIYLEGPKDFLGMSIVGQNYADGESRLFVGDVITGGAVSRDGRVQPGDLILAVNGVSLAGKSNKEAVDMLRYAIKRNRAVTLTIIGSWDDASVTSSTTRVQPIEPWQWLAHSSLAYQSHHVPETTAAPAWPNYKTLRSQTSVASSSLSSSMPSTAAQLRTRMGQKAMPLETPTDIIANKLRLFIITRNSNRQAYQTTRNTVSMNGAELQMWLYRNIKGFKDLAEAAAYASQLITSKYLVPASTYLLPGSAKSSNQQFSRSENYIVSTRPMTPGARSLSPLTKSPRSSERSGSTSRLGTDRTTDRLQLLRNQLSSTGLSVRHY